MDFIDALLPYLPEAWLVWVSAAIALCAAVATVLPAPKAGGARLYALLYQLVRLVALNKAKAKNARDASTPAQTQTETQENEKEQV